MKRLLFLVAAILAFTRLSDHAHAVSVTVQFQDASGFGFNDTTAATPVGGNSGTTLGAQREIALQYAISRWSANISGSKPIGVKVRSVAPGRRDGGGTLTSLASASPLKFAAEWTTGAAPAYAGTFYPTSLADQLADYDFSSPNHGTWDIQINHNISYDSLEAGDSDTRVWYYGLDSKAPGTDFDFVGVMLHELGHGLGFISNALQDGTWGASEQPNGTSAAIPTVWDQLIVDGAGNSLVGMNQASRDAAVEGNNLFVGGAILRQHNNTNRARLNAPASWTGGSSMHHLNEATYPSPTKATTHINELMTPVASQPTQVFGPHVMDLLQDMGYTMADTQIPLPPSIEIPVAGRSMKSSPMPVVSGTALDKSGAGDNSAAGILWVKIALSRGTDFYNWTSNAFEGGGFNYANHTKESEVDNIPIPTGVRKWKLTLPAGLAEGGYVVHASAIDMLNQGTDFVTTGFTIDNSAPSVQIVPYNELATVFDLSDLRVSAPGAVSGLLKIYYTSGATTYYWAGNSWISTDTSFPLGAEGGGLFLPGSLPGRGNLPAPGQVFFVRATVVDGASNSSTTTRGLYRSAADTTAPVATFGAPAAGEVITTNYLTGIQGTVQDAESGITSVSLTWTHFLPGGGLEFWNGSSWGPLAVNLPLALSGGSLATDLKTWQAPAASWALPGGALLPNGSHSIQITATNRESPAHTSGLGRSFTVDYHPTYYWRGSGWWGVYSTTNDWSDPWAWAPWGVPGANDIAVVENGTVNAGSQNVHGLIVRGGTVNTTGISTSGFLKLEGGTVDGALFVPSGAAFTWKSGAIYGPLSTAAGSTSSIAGAVALAPLPLMNQHATWENSGTVTQSGLSSIVSYANCQITNKPGGIWYIDGPGDAFQSMYGHGVFRSEGRLEKRGPGAATFGSWPTQVAGEVTVTGGAMEFRSPAAIENGTAFTGSGALRFFGYTRLLGVVTTTAGLFELADGTFEAVDGSAVVGNVRWSSGGLAGKLIVPSGSFLEVVGSGAPTMNQYAEITNRGTMRWSGPSSLNSYANNVIHNRPDARFEILNGGVPFSTSYGNVVFENDGMFVKTSGTATASISSWEIRNRSGLRSEQGAMEFHCPLALHDGGAITGAGQQRWVGAAVTLTGVTTLQSPLEFVSGHMTANGQINGDWTWQGGSISGTLTNPPGNRIIVDGAAVKHLDQFAVVHNNGTLRWDGPGPIRPYANGVLNNNATGVVELAADGTPFDTSYGSNVWNHSGILRKTGGTGISVMDAYDFRHSGEVRADIGGLDFTSTNGGYLRLQAASLMSGPGLVRLKGSTGLEALATFSAPVEWHSVLTGTAQGAIAGTLAWVSGEFYEDLRVVPGATLRLPATAASRYMGQFAHFANEGTFDWAGGSVATFAYSWIENRTGSHFLANSEGQLARTYGGDRLTFAAGSDLSKTSAATSSRIDWAVENNASWVLGAGALELSAGGNSGGGFVVQTGVTLKISGADEFKMKSGGTFAGTPVRITGVVNAQGAASGPVSLEAGGLLAGSAPGTFSMLGGSSLSGGTLRGNISVAPAATVPVTGTIGMDQYAVLTVDGLLAMQSAAAFAAYANCQINTSAGGTLRMVPGSSLTQAYGGNRFTNNGTMEIPSVGTVASAWAVTQGATGKWRTAITAVGAGWEAGRWNTGDGFTFGGSLILTGGEPPPGTELSVMGYGGLGGAFASVANSTGTAWTPRYDSNQLVVISPALVAPTFSAWVASFNLIGTPALPNEDPDGDGVENLLEYALGMNPTSSSGSPTRAGRVEIGGLEYLTLTYVRPAGAQARPWASYTGERSTALAPLDWSPVGVVGHAITPAPDGLTETVILRSAFPMDASAVGKEFLHLRVLITGNGF